MKTAKKIASLVLALAMLFCLCVSALADDPTPTPFNTEPAAEETDRTLGTDVNVKVAPAIEGTITWGTPSFTYTTSTNKWTLDEGSNNSITVANTGAIPFKIKCAYENATGYTNKATAYLLGGNTSSFMVGTSVTDPQHTDSDSSDGEGKLTEAGNWTMQDYSNDSNITETALFTLAAASDTTGNAVKTVTKYLMFTSKPYGSTLPVTSAKAGTLKITLSSALDANETSITFPAAPTPTPTEGG